MHVIGTAGHVDHGKTTLVSALTGINPDRLKEEQEREMTIDLGFAWLTLPTGEEVGIVDVPGHRDFIENMLAGVGGIDAVLLVIAADEGVMPQTREHLSIIDLLQIQSGLVVLTKIDLVEDPGWLDLVEADIRSLLAGTILENASIVRVSSREKTGLPELLHVLAEILQASETNGNRHGHVDLGRPRLPIDRVFSMAGFGTVVTGTLADGDLSAGDEVVILPSGQNARIRGLQNHKKKTANASAGTRTAVNLSGLDMDQVHRGDVIARPGQYRPTRRLDVNVRLLPDISSALHHGNEVKFFIGTSETIARLRLLGTDELKPGATGWLQLETQEPVVAVRGDRFILRRPSPGETIAGGLVVDPQPKGRHKRFNQAVLDNLRSLAHGTPEEILYQAFLALGPATEKDAISRSRLESDLARDALHELLASGQLLRIDNLLITSSYWSGLRAAAVDTIEAFHKSNPLRRGMPREELKSRLKLQPNVFNPVLKQLSQEQTISEIGALVSLPGFSVRYSPEEQRTIQALMARFIASPYAPPTIKECQAEVGEAVYTSLVESGELVAVSSEVVFRASDLETMRNMIFHTLRQKDQVTLAEVRDLLNTSRRYVQALLEYLDAIGFTARDGDTRRLVKN